MKRILSTLRTMADAIAVGFSFLCFALSAAFDRDEVAESIMEFDGEDAPAAKALYR